MRGFREGSALRNESLPRLVGFSTHGPDSDAACRRAGQPLLPDDGICRQRMKLDVRRFETALRANKSTRLRNV